MAGTGISYWKQLWRWTTSKSLSNDDMAKALCAQEVVEGFRLGLASFKPLKSDEFSKLQAKHPEHTKLLSIVQTIQSYMDVDSFQVWEILKNYLCDISYGTPANALKNVAFLDTRPSFLLPNVWSFYLAERQFLLKLFQYVYQFKNDTNHVYQAHFSKIINDLGVQNIKSSLISQLEKLLSTAPPSRKIQSDFSSETVRLEWAESNLKEQLAILQIILQIAAKEPFTEEEFNKLFALFRKHNFGKNHGFNDLLEERHRESCTRIMYMEVCIFMVIVDGRKIKDVSKWIDGTMESVEYELTKLQMNTEHSAMLITWMMLTLQSPKHSKLFESQYQHYGATALKMQVFTFLREMLESTGFSDKSKCAMIGHQHTLELLNDLCDKFDGDGTLSHQPGVMELCAHLLQSPQMGNYSIADEFWKLHQGEQQRGVVSLWNTALEYFPYNFSGLSMLAASLAAAGKNSARNLVAELKNLPVYTEIYDPNIVPIMTIDGDDAIIGREYHPLLDDSYRIEVGSRATIMERKEATMIHFRTPYSYWTIFGNEMAKALDRKHNHSTVGGILQRIYEGTKVLKGVVSALAADREIPKALVSVSESVFDVLVRYMRSDAPALSLLTECLEVCTALIPLYPKEIHLRLINTGLLPRILNQKLSYIEYANGLSLDSAAVGSYLVTVEQPTGSYKFLAAYIDLLCAFHEASPDDRIIKEIILPGLMFVLQEVFPNIHGWRYTNVSERRDMLQRCATFMTFVLQSKDTTDTVKMLKQMCIYNILHTENAIELLKIISVGNNQLERTIQSETNWISGSGTQHVSTIQRCLAILMFVLKLKHLVGDANQLTPLEHLIFSQNKQKDLLKVVPRVASYISHAYNVSLPVLACRLLKKFADGFQMSLFASLDMTAYQVRVLFLDRLRDDYETTALKVAILEFIATCIGKQPGLTEVFFMMNHERAKADEKNDQKENKSETDDSHEGILGYMAEYLKTVKSDVKLLHSPLLACIMAIFHALWKNNMQILVKKLREDGKFWEHMTSPLFTEIHPELRTYAQIFNVIGIELFYSREKIDDNLKDVLEMFFDVNKNNLDTWIDHIFAFKGRGEDEPEDKVPIWLGLLTSWKDFTTIFCKCMPISLNIAHKSKMVAPCMNALLTELDDLKDGRLVVILAELYVIMLANWKDDCFENRKASARQIENLLTNTAIVYECLHPRAVRAILSIGTVAISSLDYEIKANSVIAQGIIRSVTNINSIELEKVFESLNDHKIDSEEVPTVVLSLAMLEQCLDLYDEIFSGLSKWFESSRFINKVLCCLQSCLQNRNYYHTCLAALRCLTAYARGPFSKDLLVTDIDQFLWIQLLPPKFDVWKPHEWWRIYASSLDFISMLVMKHGEFFANDAITFVGVHLEHLVEAILLPRQTFTADSVNLCAAALSLIVQLVKFEARWRIRNIHSLVAIMRSISVCVHSCVWVLIRCRRAAPAAEPPSRDLYYNPPPAVLHRTLEGLHMATFCLLSFSPDLLSLLADPGTLESLHMATLCLLSFSPDLLSLLADPGLDIERFQPLVELHFGTPKVSREPLPQLTFGTLVSVICLLTRSLNHAYHSEESGGRSPHSSRRRACSCSSPGEPRRADSVASVSSAASAPPALDDRLAAAALHALVTLLAEQALLAVRDPSVPSRHKQLVRRELASELAPFHDFVRKRILCAAHTRPALHRNKLGSRPLAANEDELLNIERARKDNRMNEDSENIPPPPPPKRASTDSMREYILRKQYLDKCAQTPTKGPSPVSHSTPTSDKKKDSSRCSKRVSWAETTRDSDEDLDSTQEIEPAYSNLTDVQINNDEDYFHFMSIVFLYICQTDL